MIFHFLLTKPYTLLYASKSKITSRVTAAKSKSELKPILEQSFVYQGQIYVHKMSLQDIDDSESHKNAFYIHVKGEKEPLLVASSSHSEKVEWMQTLAKAIADCEKRKGKEFASVDDQLPSFHILIALVFGVSLETLLSHPTEQGRAVPSVVEKTVTFIENTCRHSFLYFAKFRLALDLEGIFRLSGGALLIEKMKDQLDRGKSIDFDNVKDCHAVAGLLKSWLRELPEPLMTFSLYANWIGAASRHKH
jgi:hypothetical protein